VLLFTNKGSYIYLPVHELPDIRWKDLGQHVSNLVALERDESIIKVLPIEDFNQPQFILFFTKNGMAKKTELQQYQAQRYSKALVAINLKGDDEVVDVHLTDGSKEVFLASRLGYGLRFDEAEISVVGQRAAGVKGMNLKEGDRLVSGKIIEDPEKDKVFIATQRGAVKKMKVSEFDKTSRAKRGVLMLRELKAHPHRIAGAVIAGNGETVSVVTEKGHQEDIPLHDLRDHDRYSNGSFAIDEEENGTVAEVWKQEPEEAAAEEND
jgi:topoisomerase-4 subunit A